MGSERVRFPGRLATLLAYLRRRWGREATWEPGAAAVYARLISRLRGELGRRRGTGRRADGPAG